ncbi:ATP-dependent DNA helicase [Curvibacter sp. HBC61]|uniref:DNA 5'-3' helicase n=1 Tax=Curvibacter cyanobacteriorum TaxID=3026422 RepID=A0ABT5MT68_9BURK|nr:ATP-dependent DNA helicase [Curvibacter sp. HBC61]MDD0837237.1 ATP-dependent DNA helicase [Curvibacter sp. HBC61]
MTGLDSLAGLLGPGGTLQQLEPGFQPRAGQLQLAEAVAQVLRHGGVLVAEAGTGVGKTYAYLLPALLSGQRVLLSTATRNLQDQLSTRDLPRLMGWLGLSRRVAVLKGRNSYLCTHRLSQARREGHYLDDAALRQLAQVERWALGTRSGDLAELPELDDASPLIPLVTSTRDNCLGARCAGWQGCHVNEARRLALAAEVVVVNHHLFFADQQLRDTGVAELLPQVQAVIFDEAHRLNEIGVQFMGRQFSTRGWRQLSAALLEEGTRWARGFQPWPELASLMERQVRDFEAWVGAAARRPEARLLWLGASPEGLDPAAWRQRLLGLDALLARAEQALQLTQEAAPELRRLAQRVLETRQRLRGFMDDGQGPAVRWLETGRHTRLLEVPLNIGAKLSDLLKPEVAAPGGGPASGPVSVGGRPPPAWVFTSATLGVDEGLSWFTQPCGLADLATVLRVDSPFDYARQAAWHVPEGLPDAQDPEHAWALSQWLLSPVRLLRGRTLVLATSLRALGELARGLQEGLQGTGIEVLVQGQGSRRRLLERFRQGATGTPCVLVASGAFWEGVDVPGEALQMLVIDKLPFPVPDDPLVLARSAELKAQGRTPFQDYVLPETAMALKQGVGRLIRSEHDRGVLILADERLHQRSYGRRLMAALPAMPCLADQAALMDALAALSSPQAWLTRSSTTDPRPCS